MTRIGEFQIRNEHQIPFARQLAQRLCMLARLSIGDQARLTTAVSQVTQSLFLYCRSVLLTFDVDQQDGRHWLRVTLEEQSANPNPVQATQGSKLSREDLTGWLEGVRALVSYFSASVEEDRPVQVTISKPFPPWQPNLPEEGLDEWARILAAEPPKQPIEVILQQNRELVRILDTLREKDAALEKKIEEIENLERMRDDLVHMLVHDLRNPLTSIRTSLSGLLVNGKSGLDEYQQMMVEVSYLGVLRMSRLVDNILEVYKFEHDPLSIEPTLFPFDQMLDRLLRLQGPLLEEKHLRTHVEIPDGVPLVDGDHELLERVLQNLLDNAIKHSPVGGSIHILVESEPVNSRNPLGGEFSRFIQARIRDLGPGIPVEDRLTLFEKFSNRGGPESSGGGLGLAFCRLVLRAHGGDIWLEEAFAGGTEFVILLPAAASSARKRRTE